jgi:hypothetical protein
MAVIAAALKHMLAAGMDPDAIVEAVEDMEAAATSRSRGAERQARYRERNKASRVTDGDACDGDEQKGLSPQTPLSKNSLPPVSPKGKTYPQAEFDEFWSIYPKRVAKPDAKAKFAKAMRRASFEEIMAGLRRYIAKTDDAPWCNPSTWLHNDRWADEPAEPVPRQGTGPPQGRNPTADLDAAIFGDASQMIEVIPNDR